MRKLTSDDEKADLEEPNSRPMKVLACTTAHPALDKACFYFGMELIKIPPNEKTLHFDPEDLREAMDEDVREFK
jgi:glutamate/tyrosine decarboxylase-like PLP-dependent enzyme